MPSISRTLLKQATAHIRDILMLALEHRSPNHALVVFDGDSELSVVLTAAYRNNLPNTQFINFNHVNSPFVLAAFEQLAVGDLVVLIQSSSFRLDAFRIRVELFKRGLKVIEHPHLGRMTGDEVSRYLDALAYDADYYRGVGGALKDAIDVAPNARIDSGGGAQLHFSGALEAAKLNIGDYRGMQNVGGQFPIGEVFTEAQNLLDVQGQVRIFVFGDTRFAVNEPEHPITLEIVQGQVVSAHDSTPEFDSVLAQIRADEGCVWVRELGFGMNRALSQQRKVSDIGTYERMCGIHLSLGAKHGVYSKPNIRRASAKYHVDVFAVTEAVWLGEQQVYRNGAWHVLDVPLIRSNQE
jgi:aminopeptidase